MSSRKNMRRTRTIRRKGMTLIELLVSVAVLVIMILMFATILHDSQQVVSTSQLTMQANAQAAAIAEVIRNDIRRITKEGFLYIGQRHIDGTPFIGFTTAGVSPSSQTDAIGTGTVVLYALTPNASGNGGRILRRRAWILDPEATGDLKDVKAVDLTVIISGSLQGPGLVSTLDLNGLDTDTVQYPAALDQMDQLWQCLTTDCNTLSITWTDGQVDPATNETGWYGVYAKGDQYVAYGRDPQETQGATYKAFWTRHDQNNWPKAIRIRFTLAGTGSSMAQKMGESGIKQTDVQGQPDEKVYEVICPIQ